MKLKLPAASPQHREYIYSFRNGERTLDFTMKTEWRSGKNIFKINRSNLTINGEKPDETIVGELVAQSAETLFQLAIQTNSYGHIQDIENHEEICDRWKNFSPRFREFYETTARYKCSTK